MPKRSSQTNKEIEYVCSQCSVLFQVSKTPEPMMWQHVIKNTCPSCYYTPDHVIDNLYISNYQCAKSLPNLQKRGINRIVVCGNELKAHFPVEIEYLKFELDDTEDQMIRDCFEEAYTFISSAPNCVLVHCYAGISRSSTIVISYLMKRYDMTYFDAEHFLRSKRRCIEPNDGFQRQLLEYDRWLASKRILTVSSTSIQLPSPNQTNIVLSSTTASIVPVTPVTGDESNVQDLCDQDDQEISKSSA